MPRRRFQAGADQLLVVAGEDVLVGEGGVGPADAAVGELSPRRLDQLRPADLLETLGREPRDDELPALVEHPDPVAVADEVDRRPARLGNRVEALPEPIAGPGIEAAQLTVTVDAVEVV